MANSDDPLDRLYERLHELPGEAGSPEDLDAQLRAAARDSLGSAERGSPVALWQKRFGWASAATVLLSSVLFLSLPETPSLLPADSASVPGSGESSVEDGGRTAMEAADALPPAALVQDPVAETVAPAKVQKRQVGGARAPITAPAPAPAAVVTDELMAEAIVVSSSAPASPAPAARDADSPISIAQFAGAKKPQREKQREKQQDNEQIGSQLDAELTSAQESRLEEIVVTGTRARSRCDDYDDLLIARVCREDAASFTFHASRRSRCRGLSLTVDTLEQKPTPHASSDRRRFVLEEEGGPTQVVICRNGRLTIRPFTTAKTAGDAAEEDRR